MKKISMQNRIFLALSTLGPVGYLPKAPGTWAALTTCLFVPFCFVPLPVWIRVVVLLLLFLGGGVAASRSEKLLGLTDPGVIVIDELLGQLITFTPFLSLKPWELFTGFFLFRCFDILKPWPVKASETWLPAGFGVMLDDLLAGAYACIALAGIRMLLS